MTVHDLTVHDPTVHDLPFTELVAAHGVPGAQLAVRHAGHTTKLTAGVASTSDTTALGDDAAFPIGSVTKSVTASLIMLLAADGDLDLDAPVTDHLPALGPPRNGWPALTLRHVLSHRGGLPAAAAADCAGRERWVARTCRQVDLDHPPGSAFSYSGPGYVLAGSLIELITGMDWAEAVESILLRPLGIRPAFTTGTGFVGGHTRQPDGRLAPVPTQSPAVEAPEGALALSATGLLAFAAAHLPGADGPLAGSSAAMRVDQLTGDTIGAFGMADGWGLGLARYGTGWWGHDGSAPGTSCHLRFAPQDGTIVAFTANSSDGRALWEALVPELRAAGIDVGHCPLDRLADPGEPVPARADCAGSYVNGAAGFDITARDGELYLSFDPATPHAIITCYPDLRFTARELAGRGSGYTGRFLLGADGRAIERVQIAGQLARRVAGACGG